MGWICILIILAVLIISRCSSSETPPAANNDASAANVAQQAIAEAVTAQPPPPIEPLSMPNVRSGLKHFALAGVEGLAGEMIYSQNCYDLLSREFTWANLDRCGAFDSLAARQLQDNESASTTDTDATWFDPETAAGRYLKAATAAGEPSEEADQRLSILQARVASGQRAKAEVSPTPSLIAIENASTMNEQQTVLPSDAPSAGE